MIINLVWFTGLIKDIEPDTEKRAVVPKLKLKKRETAVHGDLLISVGFIEPNDIVHPLDNADTALKGHEIRALFVRSNPLKYQKEGCSFTISKNQTQTQ